MYCTKCGNKLKSSDKFCSVCGKENDIQKKESADNNLLNDKDSLNNNNDNVSVVFGILSLCLCFVPIVGLVLGIIAIVKGRRYAKNSNNKSSGFVLGIFGSVLSLLLTIIMIIGIYFVVYFISEEDGKNIIDWEIEDKWEDIIDDDDDIIGYNWQSDVFSMLYLNDDYSYKLYIDDSDHDNNYYVGNYMLYNEEDAIDYIANNIPEYGISKEDQLKMFNNSNYDIDDYYLLVLNCLYSNIDGKIGGSDVSYYYGFYDENKRTMKMINMETKDNVNFTRKNKIYNGNSNDSINYKKDI